MSNKYSSLGRPDESSFPNSFGTPPVLEMVGGVGLDLMIAARRAPRHLKSDSPSDDVRSALRVVRSGARRGIFSAGWRHHATYCSLRFGRDVARPAQLDVTIHFEGLGAHRLGAGGGQVPGCVSFRRRSGRQGDRQKRMRQERLLFRQAPAAPTTHDRGSRLIPSETDFTSILKSWSLGGAVESVMTCWSIARESLWRPGRP